MTEVEWDACTDPTPMLEVVRGKASDRKLRLFAVAWWRRVPPALTSQVSREAVEVSARYADQLATAEELRAARTRAQAAIRSSGPRSLPWRKAAVSHIAKLAAVQVAADSCGDALEAVRSSWAVAKSAAAFGELCEQERRSRAALLYCIFGNPFRSVALDPSWRAWNDGAVQKLSQAIYDDRAFDRMPLLADALEDAGCTGAAILTHCRGQGEHVRGCWVLDILTGRE